ncbi:MAG: VWA domain-containing protein [Deltaproteobacteria bacterium]|jgi:uncharacterized protein YegL|nr:VWA domain-containing protein [Deltaproteobacteria bacterium]
MTRRLPVYLLLDVSESMAGPPLRAVDEGVRLMLRALKKNPYALETLHMSVITFAARAEVALPLTELLSVVPPKLAVRPGTAMGAALTLCRELISRDVKKSLPGDKGDYRPLVFILTDGAPTDDWRGPAADLKRIVPRPGVIALGCGEDVELETLSRIAETTVSLADVTPEGMEILFSWVSASLAVSSQAAGAGECDGSPAVSLEKSPLREGLTLVKFGEAPPRSSRPRLFLHRVCQRTGGLYVAVYRSVAGTGRYLASGTHPLPEDFLQDGAAPADPVDVSLLAGPETCPYCGNMGIFYCDECRTSYCFDVKDSSGTCYCRGCGKTYMLGDGNESFDVPGSSG